MTVYDLIIVGAGAMGSAAAYHAAKRGLRALVLEQFEIDHQRGSSYGASRIIRYAYTHPTYVEMAKAAFPMWAALESEAGERLYTRTGGIDFGVRGISSLDDTIKNLVAAQIAHEVIDVGEAMRRYPQFRFADDIAVLVQPDTGALAASKCVRSHVRLAKAHGANVLDCTPVTRIEIQADSVTVHTGKGEFSGARLILTAGAWMKGMLADLGLDLPLSGQRSQEIYFEPTSNAADYLPGRMPIFIDHAGFASGDGVYGLPSIDGSGVKAAIHGGDTFSDPSVIDYTPDLARVEQVREWTRQHIPALAEGRLVSTRVCLYTMTPDEHFIIDHHPAYQHVAIGSPCSGHGFKFSTLIGSILVDLAVDGRTDHDLALFRVSRFLTM